MQVAPVLWACARRAGAVGVFVLLCLLVCNFLKVILLDGCYHALSWSLWLIPCFCVKEFFSWKGLVERTLPCVCPPCCACTMWQRFIGPSHSRETRLPQSQFPYPVLTIGSFCNQVSCLLATCRTFPCGLSSANCPDVHLVIVGLACSFLHSSYVPQTCFSVRA